MNIINRMNYLLILWTNSTMPRDLAILLLNPINILSQLPLPDRRLESRLKINPKKPKWWSVPTSINDQLWTGSTKDIEARSRLDIFACRIRGYTSNPETRSMCKLWSNSSSSSTRTTPNLCLSTSSVIYFVSLALLSKERKWNTSSD